MQGRIDKPEAQTASWRRFAALFVASAAVAALGAAGVVLAIDPYGMRARPGRTSTPIMDLNQRYMYPQIVRSGRYDAAVFGTSTIRLLDPERLNPAFGARFANLGLNAGTPWEQMQLLDLFLRHVRRPKALILGLDRNWCDRDADVQRVTFRGFPAWLYDDDRLNDIPNVVSMKSLEIASRVVLRWLRLMPERIRGDGYEVFLPPETRYDLARARSHIWQGSAPRTEIRDPHPVEVGGTDRASFRMPALDWLDAMLRRIPRETEVLITFMPLHIAVQAPIGGAAAAWDEECKARIARMAAMRGALAVDFRRPSPVTVNDENYWDPLHYRLGIADRIVEALATARATPAEPADGFYRVIDPAAAKSARSSAFAPAEEPRE